MLFFQLALLAGYGYAHVVVKRLTPKTAHWTHAGLLLISVLTLPVIPSTWWKPHDGSLPILRILVLLTVTVGAPYCLLASTSPLLQSWYARSRGSGIPYRFFALSNLGSMLALLSYPVVVEPRIPLRVQAWCWSAGYLVFAALCFALSRGFGRHLSVIPAEVEPTVDLPQVPSRSRFSIWLALAACPSALLLAVTNHITQNVAAIPFLWVLPLSLYLLSFILTFESTRWYHRRTFLGLFAVSIGGLGYAVAGQLNIRDLRVLLPLFLTGLFICCMVCHGELVRRKPDVRELTTFYLTVALGGALGGLFVAVLAPTLFPALIELPILLIATAGLVIGLAWGDRPTSHDRKREFERAQFWPIWIGSIAAAVWLAGYLVQEERHLFQAAHLLTRNFYGALRVTDDDELGIRELTHGTINHGEQYLDPDDRRQPITYYAPQTGIGRLMKSVRQRGPFRLGVIGLGTGTMAAFGRSGDAVRFYEINPLDVSIANSEFTYLRDSPAAHQIVVGDARLSLEREPDQHFDVLVVDAFSGDSIPVHLLTREAFQVYWRHLKPDGTLAVHTSNKYLNLAPPVALLAQESGREAHLIENKRDDATRTFSSDWILVGQNEGERYQWIKDAETVIAVPPGLRVWTDDFSNLWQVLR